MKRKRIDVDLATRVATEHLSYRSLLEEIETDLERVGRGGGASLDNLRRLLASFHAHVRGHFALEEKGGLFEVYGEHGLDFRRQAQAMLDQHRDFLARLQAIRDLTKTITRLDGPEFARFSADLRALILALRRHEREEDELLERLVDEDVRRGPGHP